MIAATNSGKWIGADRCDALIDRVLRAGFRARRRTMTQFTVDEIRAPSGPAEGMRITLDRQPFVAHWLAEIDSGNWTECLALGPSQSGKSLFGFVVPICYHLFERQEDVIAAAPDQEICRDKWLNACVPVIERTRYRDLLPRVGRGSKGGWARELQFGNGVTLRWLTGGGDDKARSSYTSRVIAITEVDGFDQSQTTSDEGSQLSQIKARANAWTFSQRRIYEECTVSRETKYTWHTYDANSSRARILCRCPHCGRHVGLEREDLRGWEDAKSEAEARANTAFYCSACGERWSEHDRKRANLESVVIHGAQELVDGAVIGELPETRTLGFRWTAANNLFADAADLGAEEWKAKRDGNPDLKERELRQFIHTLPVIDEVDALDLSSETVRRSTVDPTWTKGIVPSTAKFVSLGVDVGKRLLHWTCVALLEDGSRHVVDYGRVEVASDDLKPEVAMRIAFRELRELTESIKYDIALVDIHYLTEVVLSCIADAKQAGDSRWQPYYGQGDNHWAGRRNPYRQPTKKDKYRPFLGTRYYLERREGASNVLQFVGDACHWKNEVQQGFVRGAMKADKPGTISLFHSSDSNQHVGYAAHVTAERQEVVFERGKGHITKWVTLSRSNHWLDATYIALVGLTFLMERPPARATPRNRVLA